MKLLMFWVVLFHVMGSHAGGLTAPFDLENTSVLPKGINNVRLRGIWINTTDAFSGNGRIEPVGAKLNKQVTWEKVIKAQDKSLQPIARASINSLCEKGLDCSEKGIGPGSTTGNLEVNVNVTVPTFVRGLTDKTSFILAVPIYSVDIRVESGFDPSAAYNQWLTAFNDDPYQKSKIKEKFVDPINTKAADNSYKPVESRTFQEIGDVKIGAKTAWPFEEQNMRLAVKYLLSLPTGRAPDPDQIIDVPTGDGGYGLSVIGVGEYLFGSQLSLLGTLGVNYQFEDRIERRIPTASDDPISADKEKVDRKRGNQYAAGAIVSVGSSIKGLSGGVGYNLQYMEQTRFSGSQYDKTRYKYLEYLNPSQVMESATLMLQYSTIDAYKQKSFVLPMTVSLSYSNVFNGKNVAKSDLVSSELLLFF